MADIKQLKDKNGDGIFPVTHINGIFDDQGEQIFPKLATKNYVEEYIQEVLEASLHELINDTEF